MNRRDQIIDAASKLEALPAVALELLDVLKDPDADAKTVARVIEHDPALTANVLKLANAAAMGTQQRIYSIKDALVRIGLRKTAEVVLDVAVAPYAGKPIGGYDLPAGAMWQHSAATAIATDVLAETLDIDSPIEAFTAGLLHDIGKLALGQFVDIHIEPIRQLAFEQGLSFEQAEREVLGIDHAEVGAVLLEAWGIEGPLRETVRWHHQPECADLAWRPTVDRVHAAVQIVTAAGIGGGADGAQYHTSRESIDHLGLGPAIVEKVLCETVTRLGELCQLNPRLSGSDT